MLYVSIFLVSIVAANLVVQMFGPAVTPIVAFVFIGLDLSMRDKIHEAWHGNQLRVKMFFLVLSASAITYLLNKDAAQIALASSIAFFGSMVADAFVYEKFFEKSKLFKMNSSNAVSAAVDTVLFIWIAFGVFMWKIMLVQYLAKAVGGLVWSYLLTRKVVENYGDSR